MRSYGQYCGVARALDVIGDRWTLLIVRELLIRQPCRYTDLQHGLPGIATNLLADRLRQLEEHGVVTREAAPPPIATTVFRLTPRGEELRSVLRAIGRWGWPLMQEPVGDAVYRSHWLAMPLEFSLRDADPDGPPITIEVRTGDEQVVVETIDGAVRTRVGTADRPDAVITGSPTDVLALLNGSIDIATARTRGVTLDGSQKVLRRLRPVDA